MVFTMQNHHLPPPKKNPTIKKAQNRSHRGEMPSLSVSLARWSRSEEEEVAVTHC